MLPAVNPSALRVFVQLSRPAALYSFIRWTKNRGETVTEIKQTHTMCAGIGCGLRTTARRLMPRN